MNENPYQSPMEYTPAVGVKTGKREDVRSVAVYQKGILVCILIYLVAVIGQFALPPELRLVLGLGVMVVGITGLVFVFLLSVKVYNVGIGILLGLLTMFWWQRCLDCTMKLPATMAPGQPGNSNLGFAYVL